MSVYSRTQAAIAAPTDSTGAITRWLRASFRKWRRRKMIASLCALDDRILWDIGIHRSEIERAVDGLNDAELRMRPVAPPAGNAATGSRHA